MISRQNVLNTLGFLVVSMIVINLYTFVLMMSTMAGGSSGRNHRTYLRNVADNHEPDRSNSNSKTNPVSNTQKNETVVEHRNFKHPPITTVRFIRKNGKIMLEEEPGVKPLSVSERNELFRKVLRRLRKHNIPPSADIGMTIRIVGRARRAFNGSDFVHGRIQWGSFNRVNSEAIWQIAGKWPFLDNLNTTISLGQILPFAHDAPILQATCSRRGTQLKLNLILEGGQVALFKPRWYSRDVILNGDVYGGKDRHFGEIAAFYLSQILGYNSAPLTVGRTLNLKKDILPVSTNQLKNTFLYDKEGNHCFYGVCYYCGPHDPVCANGEQLEGALILLMNQRMISVPNPWSRTYKHNVLAPWEVNMSYCQYFDLKRIALEDREDFILDIVAVSIFDFLIGNGDRHRFDVLEDPKVWKGATGHSKRILLIDNGKSFGNPYEDYVDILAPLYQCCRIREPLWSTLKEFQYSDLGKAVDSLSESDPLHPLLTREHQIAINERLKIVIAFIETCHDRYPNTNVIVKT